MADIFEMDLRLFGDGAGAGAAAAGGAGTGDGGEAAAVTPGTLADGTVVDNRLAARMEEQARKRRSRGEKPAPVQAIKAEPQAAAEQPAEEKAAPSLEDEWIEAKKGKFRDLYAQDVQGAIKDRFKNQADANERLGAVQPVMDALIHRYGTDNTEELIKAIQDEDGKLEEEAEEAGMTVEGYKTFREMQAENQRIKAQEAQAAEEMMLRQHFQKLAMQAEELKKTFPDFDLRREMDNETFRRLVAPNSGLDLQAAYYAVHHTELEPQVMAYGFQKAQQQISQTLQSNQARPVEGAIKGGRPADVSVDPRRMTREDRQKLIERARRGETIIF